MTDNVGTQNQHRLRREAKTVELMIGLYCRQNHGPQAQARTGATAAGDRTATGVGPDALCPDCAELLAYSRERVQACRFGAAKPTCARCTVHCFRPVMREQIRAVMRYSGPRMTYRHPYLALRHLIDRRVEPGGQHQSRTKR